MEKLHCIPLKSDLLYTKFQTNLEQELCLSNPIVITLRQSGAWFDSCFCKLKLSINTLSDIGLIVTINFILNGGNISYFRWSSSLRKPKEPSNASKNELKARLNKFHFQYSQTKDKATDQRSILWFWSIKYLVRVGFDSYNETSICPMWSIRT